MYHVHMGVMYGVWHTGRDTIPETNWINLLGMVLNRQLPFISLDRLYWGNLLTWDEGPNHCIKQLLHNVANARPINMNCEEALTFATKVVRHSDPALLEKITVLKGKARREWRLSIHRRVVVRVPTYCDAVNAKVRQVARKAIQALPISAALKEWYVEVLASWMSYAYFRRT